MEIRMYHGTDINTLQKKTPSSTFAIRASMLIVHIREKIVKWFSGGEVSKENRLENNPDVEV